MTDRVGRVSEVTRCVALKAVLLGIAALLSGCLANTVNDIERGWSDAVAPKVTFKKPARNAEASALRSVAIVADGTDVSQQIGQGLEASMTQLRVDERPHYTAVKLGPRLTTQPSDAQLGGLARSAGVEALVIVTGGNSSVRATQSTEDRYSCAADIKLLQSCPKGQTRTSKVACTTTLGFASARIRVFRVADARSVFVDLVSGESKHARCNDQNTPQADQRQLAAEATNNAIAVAMQILAPSYIQAPLDLMRADSGLPADQRKGFDAAFEFAHARRIDEACSRFEEMYVDHKESRALTFNVAFCQEVRGDLLRANQGYKRASELADAPDAQIDRRLASTDKALRESPSAFLPTSTNAPQPSTKLASSNGRRVALVIGNARYQRSALVNPVNDARLVSQQLKRIGFDVVTLENLDAARFATATRDFGSRAKGADIALFYYAGHALQADGENFLLPVDNGKMRSLEDVRDGGAVQLASIIAQLDVAAPAVKLLVVDACRDNPLPALQRSLAGGGLAAVKQPPEGGLIAFATAPGRTAEDGVGKNSVFSKHFAQQLLVANQTVEQLFKQVRAAVKNETKNKQEPTEISSLVGDVVLATTK